jgi:hypothetical protein
VIKGLSATAAEYSRDAVAAAFALTTTPLAPAAAWEMKTMESCPPDGDVERRPACPDGDRLALISVIRLVIMIAILVR